MVTITDSDKDFGMVCTLDMFQVITYLVVVHIDMVQIMVMDTDIKGTVILPVSYHISMGTGLIRVLFSGLTRLCVSKTYDLP